MFRGLFANAQDAKQALETQGYSEVEILDKAWFMVGLRGCDGYEAVKVTAKVDKSSREESKCLCVWTGLSRGQRLDLIYLVKELDFLLTKRAMFDNL